MTDHSTAWLPAGTVRSPATVMALAGALAALLCGCSTQSLQATLPKIGAQLPALKSVPGEPSRIDASPQAVYGLIATGAMRCWFAVNGQLKVSHVFHADVEPPSSGGAAEISVLERDRTGAKLWGTRTFKVNLKASGEQTTIDIENLKMPEAVAAAMRVDVFHWAQGGVDCELKPVEVTPVAAVPTPAKTKAKVKSVKTSPPP